MYRYVILDDITMTGLCGNLRERLADITLGVESKRSRVSVTAKSMLA